MNDQTQISLTGFDTALAEDNPALALEVLFSRAMTEVRRSAGKGGLGLAALDRAAARLLAKVAADTPLSGALIGFDRPANLYIVTELYQAGGHRVLLEQMIKARPAERHIVLFTGALDRNRGFGQTYVSDLGGFAIFPDPQAALYDRWLWLREKLAAYAARRVFLLHHPEDVLASMAAQEAAPRYGRRMYMVHHADTVSSLAADLAGISHIAIRPEQKTRIAAAHPGLRVALMPLANAPFEDPRLHKLHISNTRPTITATCGNVRKFSLEGALAFPAVISRVLHATGGRHIHIGPVNADFVRSVQRALTEAKLEIDQVYFTGEVVSVAKTLLDNGTAAFLNSFPVGGALSLLEAAAVGVPVLLYDPAGPTIQDGPTPQEGALTEGQRYVSGIDFHPPEALTWSDPAGLESLLRDWIRHEDVVRMVKTGQDWARRQHCPERYARRFNALIAATEGRLRQPLADAALRARLITPVFDPSFYLRVNKDVAAAGVDPLQHYLRHGEAENRLPSPLFDPKWYLDSLPDTERKRAKPLPFTHYLARGEALGYRPHPLFDPALCAQSLAHHGDASLTAAPIAADTESHPQSVLQAYLESRARIVPHMLFDPSFYVSQLPFPPEGTPLLVHFLDNDGKEMFSPHPLIASGRLIYAAGKPGISPLRALLDWMGQSAPRADEPSPHVLFDPKHLAGADIARYAAAAPNLLWAALIEGNQRGRDPHILISMAHIEDQRPGTLVEAGSALALLVRNRLGVDSHPLLSNRHVEKQAPWLINLGLSPTQYYFENAAAHNIDAHPWMSTQYYLYNNPDLQGEGVCPLAHYLTNGQYEGRLPHAFFDGNHYYHTYLKSQGGGQPLLHYAQYGAGLFFSTMQQDPGWQRLALKTARALIEENQSGTLALGAGHARAEQMLKEALHPETAMPHPTLHAETRPLLTQWPEMLNPVEIYPACKVLQQRPGMVSGTHIALTGGEYTAAAGQAALVPNALVVPGNDGFGLRNAAGEPAWYDPGLQGFDPDTMALKENAAVVAIAANHSAVLLRRHTPETALPAGIFCSGSYSQNYYHFLLEVLPRVLLAARIAPAGTPILADVGMPAQHYQALRLLLPGNPLLRLQRMRSYRVARLYAATMPTIVQDAFRPEALPIEALRYHPEALKPLAALGRILADRDEPEDLLLWRESGVRKLLNQQEIGDGLRARGLEAVNCAHQSFADQIRLIARADSLVGQSGAQLTNMIFAKPGTRVFPLYSNAPGTNYSIWSGLGTLLGLSVVNVVGWHIIGTAGAGRPETHSDFTVPVAQILPFFAQPDAPESAKDPTQDEQDAAQTMDKAWALLSDLHQVSTEADVLTGAWSVMAGPTPQGFDDTLLKLRRKVGKIVDAVDAKELITLLNHPFLMHFSNSIRSGYPLLQDHDAAETALITELTAAFTKLAETNLIDAAQPDAEADPRNTGKNERQQHYRQLILAMLYIPAWKLPLIDNLADLPDPVLTRYLGWLAAPSFLYRRGEDAAWVASTTRLLTWIEAQLGRTSKPRLQLALGRMAVSLDLGQLLLVDCALTEVTTARNRLLDRIALRDGSPRTELRDLTGQHGRIRVGILCRTFDKGPDSEAVVAFVKGFNKSRIEIFAYSVGFRDRVVSADSDFAHAFDAVIDHRRLLSSDAAEIRAQILADDLDVFLYANATTYGIRALDLALYHRVAPRQAVLNSHVPMPMGYPSFDAFITGLSDAPHTEVPQDEFRERLVRLPGSVISYLTSLQPKEKPPLSRATLGLAPDDVVLMNAGALSKLRHDCLLTMMRATAAVPKGVLLLAPYNPGWVARSQAFAFNRQLAETAAEAGLDPARIKVMGELSVAEAEAALQLADLYLTPFPHGGATMAHLALIYGLPPVVLRRKSTRSIDQFLVSSLGFPELLASTPEEYVALAARLANDPQTRQALAARIAAAVKHPVFVDSDSYSKEMERAVFDLLSQPKRDG